MKHIVTFERFNSRTPTIKEEKTVEVEFPIVNDTNIDDFERLLYNNLFKMKNTKAKSGWSSWLQCIKL